MQDDEKDQILTAEEAAEYLRMALSTLYRYMRTGQVPCFKVGNQWRFKKTVLDQWMERLSTLDVSSNVVKLKKETNMEKSKKEENINIDIGLGGIFKGLGSFIELATKLAENAPSELTKEGEIGTIGEKGVKAVYGFSIKTGAGGRPTIQQFGNVKEKAKGPVVDEVREPMVDTFDEGDFILVVAEMPGVSDPDIKYEIKGDILIISCENKDRKYYKELLLPALIDEKKITYSNRNGIVEFKLWKTEQP
jgi:HSP20 family protein